MNVRPALPADVPGILKIYNEAVLTTTATYDDRPESLDQRMAWFEDHERQNYPVLVAELRPDAIVGWSALSQFHVRPGYRFTVQNAIYVAASHRGQGIGKRLLAPLIPAAQERRWHVIMALIDADNEASRRLHAAFGFVQVGHLKEVGHKFGRWLDVIYMQRGLP